MFIYIQICANKYICSWFGFNYIFGFYGSQPPTNPTPTGHRRGARGAGIHKSLMYK